MKVLLLSVSGAVFVFGQTETWLQQTTEGVRAASIPNYVAADTNFRAALAEAEHFPESDDRLRTSLSNLASVRERRGDFAEAETLYRRRLDLDQKYAGTDRRQVSVTIINLAGDLHLAGRDGEADTMLRRALTIAEESGDESLISAALNALGVVIAAEGDSARAEPVLRRSLALFEKTTGADSLETAKAINNLAVLYSDTHQYAKAEPMIARALPLYEKHLGKEHPLLAMVLNNMFTVLAEQHRSAEGEPYLRRALAIAEKVFPESASMARIQESLGALEVGRGHYAVAAHILENVIAIEERTLGPNHPQLAHSLTNYSSILRRLHQNTEAKRVENRANSIQRTTLR